MRSTALSLGALLVLTTWLQGQDVPPVSLGARVRVTTIPGTSYPHRVVGTLLELSPEHLTLRASRARGRDIQLPRTAVSRLEVSRGRHSKVGAGLALGFLGGAAVGALVGANSDCGEYSGGVCAGATALVLALPGLLVGGVIGATTHVDRWEEIQWAGSFLPTSPQRLGFALRVRLR